MPPSFVVIKRKRIIYKNPLILRHKLLTFFKIYRYIYMRNKLNICKNYAFHDYFLLKTLLYKMQNDLIIRVYFRLA